MTSSTSVSVTMSRAKLWMRPFAASSTIIVIAIAAASPACDQASAPSRKVTSAATSVVAPGSCSLVRRYPTATSPPTARTPAAITHGWNEAAKAPHRSSANVRDPAIWWTSVPWLRSRSKPSSSPIASALTKGSIPCTVIRPDPRRRRCGADERSVRRCGRSAQLHSDSRQPKFLPPQVPTVTGAIAG